MNQRRFEIMMLAAGLLFWGFLGPSRAFGMDSPAQPSPPPGSCAPTLETPVGLSVAQQVEKYLGEGSPAFGPFIAPLCEAIDAAAFGEMQINPRALIKKAPNDPGTLRGLQALTENLTALTRLKEFMTTVIQARQENASGPYGGAEWDLPVREYQKHGLAKIEELRAAVTRADQSLTDQGVSKADAIKKLGAIHAKFIIQLEIPELTQDLAQVEAISAVAIALSARTRDPTQFRESVEKWGGYIQSLKAFFYKRHQEYFKIRSIVESFPDDVPRARVHIQMEALKHLESRVEFAMDGIQRQVKTMERSVIRAIPVGPTPDHPFRTREQLEEKVSALIQQNHERIVSDYRRKLAQAVIDDHVDEAAQILSYRVVGSLMDLKSESGAKLIHEAKSDAMKDLLRQYGGD